MKVGVKTYADREGYKYIKKIVGHCDFIEIMPLPTNSLWKKFLEFNVPVTIHAAHQKFGADPGDKKKHNKTDICLNLAIKAADAFGSDVIVVHPGTVGAKRKSCMDTAIKYLKKYKEPRFHIENLPSWKNHLELGTLPEEIANFEKEISCKTCFDFSHAAMSASMLNKDYKKFVKSFMKLKPKYFHMCGGDTIKHEDHHPLSQGNYDQKYFKSLLPKRGRVVLETPHDLKNHIKDIKFLKK